MSPEFPTPAMVLGTSKLEVMVKTIHSSSAHAAPKIANPQRLEEFAHFHNLCFTLPLQNLCGRGQRRNLVPGLPSYSAINLKPQAPDIFPYPETRCDNQYFGKDYSTRMPSSTLIPFLGGLGSLINPFKQKRAPFLSLASGQPSL